MKWLTREQIAKWLSEKGQIEDPYGGNSEPRIRIQFAAPQNYSAVECFVRCFLQDVVGRGELLFVVHDAEPSEECQRYIHAALRSSDGEGRPAAEAPGRLIHEGEKETGIALFSLMSCFGWKCYLYSERDQITLYNWEGDIFDFWTSSEAPRKALMEILQSFGLEEIIAPIRTTDTQ